jgi:hypothetical protein
MGRPRGRPRLLAKGADLADVYFIFSVIFISF